MFYMIYTVNFFSPRATFLLYSEETSV